ARGRVGRRVGDGSGVAVPADTGDRVGDVHPGEGGVPGPVVAHDQARRGGGHLHAVPGQRVQVAVVHRDSRAVPDVDAVGGDAGDRAAFDGDVGGGGGRCGAGVDG